MKKRTKIAQYCCTLKGYVKITKIELMLDESADFLYNAKIGDVIEITKDFIANGPKTKENAYVFTNLRTDFYSALTQTEFNEIKNRNKLELEQIPKSADCLISTAI